MVEFAIGATLLVTMFSGIFQFGWSLMIYNNLMTSVTNAAMMASTMDYDQGATSTFTTAVQNMAVYGDISTGTVKVAPGIQTSQIDVDVTSVSGVPQYITVSVNGYSISTIFRNFTLTNKPRVTVPFMGKVTCSSC